MKKLTLEQLRSLINEVLTEGDAPIMDNTISIILDGDKLDWDGDKFVYGMGSISDHPGFPRGGRPPAHVGVRSHRWAGSCW